MLKKSLFSILGLALLIAPVVSSADTVSNLQQQIQSLLAQLQVLQSTQAGSAASGSASFSAPARSCPPVTRTLSRGSRGDDVANLQQFLTDEGHFKGAATGYFGLATEAAVKQWQASNGLASSGSARTTGWGALGSRSRAYYMNHCGTQTAQTQSFFANPQSGVAPLTTTFSTNDSIASNNTYTVDFGDGQNAQMTKGNCIAITAIRGGQGGIRCSFNVTHTYAANGTYTAKLLKQIPYSCPNGMMCAQMMPAPQTVATIVVTVGATQSSVLNASPASGQAPLQVYFSYPDNSGKLYAVDFGDGTAGQLNYTVPPCAPGTTNCNGTYTATHTYTKGGTYTVTVSPTVQCFAAPCPTFAPVATTVVTVTDGVTANIQKVYAPASVTLALNGIAEVRNEKVYFTLTSLNGSSATIQPTPVGCWNSFPSDPVPQIRCMIAISPTPPATLSVGQSYTAANYTITLTSLTNTSATFMVADTSGNGVNTPVISGLDAPTSLSVSQQGTWAVRATAPGNSQLSYSVVWGDENNNGPYAMSMSQTVSTSATFTHTYARAGTYTPTFTVSNGSGSVQTSATVLVQ